MVESIFYGGGKDLDKYIDEKTQGLDSTDSVGLGTALSLYLNMYVDLTLLNGSDITGEGDAN